MAASFESPVIASVKALFIASGLRKEGKLWREAFSKSSINWAPTCGAISTVCWCTWRAALCLMFIICLFHSAHRSSFPCIFSSLLSLGDSLAGLLCQIDSFPASSCFLFVLCQFALVLFQLEGSVAGGLVVKSIFSGGHTSFCTGFDGWLNLIRSCSQWYHLYLSRLLIGFLPWPVWYVHWINLWGLDLLMFLLFYHVHACKHFCPLLAAQSLDLLLALDVCLMVVVVLQLALALLIVLDVYLIRCWWLFSPTLAIVLWDLITTMSMLFFRLRQACVHLHVIIVW